MSNGILVTGASGQLGSCLKRVSQEETYDSFVFVDSKELDILNPERIDYTLKHHNIKWCINCAAYTKVDDAEENVDTAFAVNFKGVENLAKSCKINEVTLIHISTDFVYDGMSTLAYLEEDRTNPVNNYGKSKLKGEQVIRENLQEFFIIRTSWLYSEFTNNFVNTMLRLANTNQQLMVVDDQIGTPTYAMDLARVLFEIIKGDYKSYGVYNYSNEGVASWYDFAKAIFEISDIKVDVNPVKSCFFKTKAKRPNFSVLDKTKIKRAFNLNIPYWRDSLQCALYNKKHE